MRRHNLGAANTDSRAARFDFDVFRRVFRQLAGHKAHAAFNQAGLQHALFGQWVENKCVKNHFGGWREREHALISQQHLRAGFLARFNLIIQIDIIARA